MFGLIWFGCMKYSAEPEDPVKSRGTSGGPTGPGQGPGPVVNGITNFRSSKREQTEPGFPKPGSGSSCVDETRDGVVLMGSEIPM